MKVEACLFTGWMQRRILHYCSCASSSANILVRASGKMIVDGTGRTVNAGYRNIKSDNMKNINLGRQNLKLCNVIWQLLITFTEWIRFVHLLNSDSFHSPTIREIWAYLICWNCLFVISWIIHTRYVFVAFSKIKEIKKTESSINMVNNTDKTWLQWHHQWAELLRN